MSRSVGPRSLDHCVMPTADLGIARDRLSALGFTVSPVGVHPFGTSNACVYFSDGTFLEPLAVNSLDLVGEAIGRQNVFVGHDAAYRSENGAEGFSALVFHSEDARADHAEFVAAGCSAGPILDFSRPARDASGREDIASFRLAFAQDAAAVDTLFFTCQVVAAPRIARASLEMHPNGVSGVASVVLTAGDPTPFGRIVSIASGAAAEVNAPRAPASLMSAEAFANRFEGMAAIDDRLRLSAIVFRVPEPEPVLRSLADAGIRARHQNDRIMVDRAPGQGAIFVFEPG